MPLVLTRLSAAIPLKTASSVVLRIELLAVDKDEIPKVITVPSFRRVVVSLPYLAALSIIMLYAVGKLLCSDSALLKLFSSLIIPSFLMLLVPPLIVPVLVSVSIVPMNGSDPSFQIPYAPPAIVPRLVIVPIEPPALLIIPVLEAEEIVPELTIDAMVALFSMPGPGFEIVGGTPVTLITPSTIKVVPGAGEET